MKKIIFLIICLLIQFSYGQVGIHKENQHNMNAILHMEAPANIAKGIMLPKYTTTQRDQLSMVNGVIKLTAEDDGLLIYNTTEKCFNMWHSDVAEWKSLCSDTNATISVDCANITVTGEYKQVVELNGTTNYITIPVTVTKAGLYNFVVKKQTDNGYNFISKLTYLTTSDTQVVLEATGTPISQSTGDIFTVIIHDNIVCSFTVPVIENPARYTLDCDNIIVRGNYKIRRELTDDHYLIVPVNVTQVGYYTLSTPIVNGFSFKSEGFFYQTGSQFVFLKATGTPLDNINANFTISSTPTGAATNTCNVTITSVLEGKKILTFGGYSNVFGYGMNQPPHALNTQSMGPRLLQSINMFGDQINSVFKVEPLIYGVHLINGGSTNADPFTYVDDNILEKYTTGPDPVDIIFFGERSELHPIGAQLVVDFIKKGGVVLYFHEYMDSNDNSLLVFRQILNSTNLTTNDFIRRNSAGELYTISSQTGYAEIPTDDMVIHGPFGDVLGKQWGEDASNTLTLKYNANYDKSQIIAYSNSKNTQTDDGITGFRHKNYNFLWFGDGGFMSSCTDTSSIICPYNADNTNRPIPKPSYGNSSPRNDAYNSIIVANALAWAIKQAEFSGINAQN